MKNTPRNQIKQIISEIQEQTREILNKVNYFACREYIMMETKHMVELILMKRCVMKEGESYSEFVRRREGING